MFNIEIYTRAVNLVMVTGVVVMVTGIVGIVLKLGSHQIQSTGPLRR